MDNKLSQEQLITEVVDACIKADLNKVKQLINQVVFESPYGHRDARKIFLGACESNNLDVIKFLIDNRNSGDNMNMSQIVSDGLKISLNAPTRNYDLIRYLAREPKLSRVLYAKDYLPGKAASEDDLVLLDAILDLKDTSKYNVYMWPKEDIIRDGCANDNSIVIKHFFTTPKLKDVLDLTSTFKEASRHQNHDLLSFFIFELNIDKTEDIAEFMEKDNNEKARKMFKIRELNDSLMQNLDANKLTKTKKPKL
jgi:hypothetical protein